MDGQINEVWKDIPKYEGYYQISNLGRVKSLERYDSRKYKVFEKILKPQTNPNGYLYVLLYMIGYSE